MAEPVLGIRFSVQRRFLDVDVLVTRVEIAIPDGGLLTRDLVRHTHFLEEWRCDEVYVLPGIRKCPHHRQRHERPHGSTIVVPWYAGSRGVKLAGDVVMDAFGALARSAGVVVEIDWKKCLLVSYVQ